MDREVKIESGIPIPPTSRPGREPKYPFNQMEVDQSFTVDPNSWQTAIRCAYSYAKRTGKKFKVRSGEYRIWRVK